MDGESQEFDPQRVRRVALRRKVSVRFREFRGFLEEVSENLSSGGMFIRSEAPQPPGSTFEFAFDLEDGFPLIHGKGEVVWVREEGEGPDRPAGMGVRFLELQPESQRLVDRIVEERLRRGGAPASPAAPATPPPASARPERPEAPETEEPFGAVLSAPAAAPAAPLGELLGEPETAPVPSTAPPDEPDPFDALPEIELDEPFDLDPEVPDLPEPLAPPPLAPSPPPVSEEPTESIYAEAPGPPPAPAPLGDPSAAPLPPVELPGSEPELEATDAGAPSVDDGEDEAPAPPPPPGEPPALPPLEPPLGGIAAEGAVEFPPIGEDWPSVDPQLPRVTPPQRGVEPELPERQERPARGVRSPYARSAERSPPPARRRWPLVVAASLGLLAVAAVVVWLLVGWPAGGVGGGGGDGAPAVAATEAPPPVAPDRAPEPPAAAAGEAGPPDSVPPAAEAAPTALPEVLGDTPSPGDPGEPEASEVGPAEPFSRLVDVVLERREGETVVVLETDGAVEAGSFRTARLSAPPRLLVRLLGVDRPYGGSRLAAGDPAVTRVRFGHHPDPGGRDELHVVFDLAGPGVRLAGAEADGSRLRLRFVGP